MGLDKPQQQAKFEVTSFRRCRNIKGNPKILGNSSSQGPRPLFFWVGYFDGLWQIPTAYQF